MKELLCKAKSGDKRALEEIINSFIPLILKESSKYIIKCYDYEDLVQHGYLSVIKAVNMFRGESEGFTPYCIKAIQLNYKALLKGQIKHHREIPDEFAEDKPDYMFTLEDEILAFEKTEELYSALDKLSPEERDIINSFYIKEKGLDEIAATTNKSYNNIRYLKSKAVKKLQKALSR